MGNGLRFLNGGSAAVFASFVFFLAPQQASADALHVFCTSPTPTCTDNGSITPTSTNPPTFGFTKSPDTGSATFYLEVLIPDNVIGADTQSFSITGTNTGNGSVLSSLFGSSAWSSGQLDAYLGISAQPTNPIGAYLPLTQAYQPSATGYFVYEFNFGAVNFGSNNPTFVTSFIVPIGSIVTAFSKTVVCNGNNCSDSWTATANSSSLLITNGTPPPSLPEPATLSLLGAGLIGMRFLKRKRAA